VRRDALGQRPVRRRGQVDRMPASMLFAQILQQRPVVRQMLHIQLHGFGQVALERRLALRNPARYLGQRPRMLPRHRQHGVDQRIGLHQRPVQVHAQRYPGWQIEVAGHGLRCNFGARRRAAHATLLKPCV
jgi:hypothetical protein